MDDQPTDDLRSDADCLAAAARSDRAAFDTIARRYQQRLMRFATRSLPLADAQDVVQETLVKAFMNAARYDPHWPVSTWMFTLARRAIVDRLRAIRRQRNAQPNPIANSVESESPALIAERRDVHTALWTIAAQRLPGEQYQAMWLHYTEELPTRDVARVMSRSWVWVKTALHRGRKTLAPHVEHLTGDGRSDNRAVRTEVPA